MCFSGSWAGNRLLCNIWLTVDNINCTATCFAILTIGIDRYWSVAHPFHYRTNMSQKWVVLYISITWSVPFLIYVPSIFMIQQFELLGPDRNFTENRTCQVHFRSNLIWVFAMTLVNFWAVLVTLTVLYVKIYKVTKFFWSRRSNRSNLPTPNIRQEPSGSQLGSRNNQSSSQMDAAGFNSNNPEICITSNGFDKNAIIRNSSEGMDVRVSQSEEYLSKRFTKRQSRDSNGKTIDNNINASVSAIQMAPCQKRRDSNNRNTSNRNWPTYDEPKSAKLPPKFKTGSISLGVPPPDHYTFRRHSSACPGDIPKLGGPPPPSPSFQDSTRLRIKRVSEAILRLPLQLIENMSEQKTSMRILTAIMTSFVVCWSPYSIVAIVHAFQPEVISAKLVELFYAFSYLSCLVNPIVYTCANLAFRDAFKKIINLDELRSCCFKPGFKIPGNLYATTRV